METKYTYFELKGIQYRYDGKNVEGKDGDTWNKTGSLSVYLHAVKVRKCG